MTGIHLAGELELGSIYIPCLMEMKKLIAEKVSVSGFPLWQLHNSMSHSSSIPGDLGLMFKRQDQTPSSCKSSSRSRAFTAVEIFQCR